MHSGDPVDGCLPRWCHEPEPDEENFGLGERNHSALIADRNPLTEFQSPDLTPCADSAITSVAAHDAKSFNASSEELPGTAG